MKSVLGAVLYVLTFSSWSVAGLVPVKPTLDKSQVQIVYDQKRPPFSCEARLAKILNEQLAKGSDRLATFPGVTKAEIVLQSERDESFDQTLAKYRARFEREYVCSRTIKNPELYTMIYLDPELSAIERLETQSTLTNQRGMLKQHCLQARKQFIDRKMEARKGPYSEYRTTAKIRYTMADKTVRESLWFWENDTACEMNAADVINTPIQDILATWNPQSGFFKDVGVIATDNVKPLTDSKQISDLQKRLQFVPKSQTELRFQKQKPVHGEYLIRDSDTSNVE